MSPWPQPSDQRLKENIVPTDTRQQLSNVCGLQLVHYDLRPAWADATERAPADRAETGVLAQQVC